VTTEEKAAAFDLLADALTNHWHDGTCSAWCQSLVDQPRRATEEECVPDLLAWAERCVKQKAKRQVGQ
jgi:hypothetical protein